MRTQRDNERIPKVAFWSTYIVNGGDMTWTRLFLERATSEVGQFAAVPGLKSYILSQPKSWTWRAINLPLCNSDLSSPLQYMTIRNHEDRANVFPAQLRIEHLDLCQCNGKEACNSLVTACPNLKSSRFEHWKNGWSGPTYRGSFDAEFDPAVFLPALKDKEGQIESLTLDHFKNPTYGFFEPSDMDVNWYGPLAGFTTLKHL